MTQEEVDALTATVSSVAGELDGIKSEFQTEVDALQTQINEGKSGTELDLTGLNTAIQNLGSHADSLKGVVPDNA